MRLLLITKKRELISRIKSDNKFSFSYPVSPPPLRERPYSPYTDTSTRLVEKQKEPLFYFSDYYSPNFPSDRLPIRGYLGLIFVGTLEQVIKIEHHKFLSLRNWRFLQVER